MGGILRGQEIQSDGEVMTGCAWKAKSHEVKDGGERGGTLLHT